MSDVRSNFACKLSEKSRLLSSIFLLSVAEVCMYHIETDSTSLYLSV